MYRIIRVNDGVELGVSDSIVYIKVSNAGSYIETAQEEAIGVACNGTPYNLFGYSEIEDAETVIVIKDDSGRAILECEKKNAQIVEQLTLADETAIELYEAHIEQEEINTAQDESLIEIYEMIGA